MKTHQYFFILVVALGILQTSAGYGLNIYSPLYPPYGITEKEGLLVELMQVAFKDLPDLKIQPQPLARSVASYAAEKSIFTGGLETVPPDLIAQSEVIKIIDADIHIVYSSKMYPKKVTYEPKLLKDKKVVILLGSRAIFTDLFKGKNIQLLELPDPDALFRVVGSGRADYGLCAKLACFAKLQELKLDGLQVMYGPMINIHGVILVHKSNPKAKELVALARKNLKDAYAKGEVQKIMEKYHFGNPVQPAEYRFLNAL